jgi:hypothetical protein
VALLAIVVPSIGVAFTLRTLIMPGKVIEAHAKIEDTCESCHEDDDGETQRELCLACHVAVRNDILAGGGFHGRDSKAKAGDCYTCHREHGGRDADIAALNVGAFAHANTDFALHGAHESVACADCHRAGEQFRAAQHGCVACHADDDAHVGALSRDCETCHSPTAWGLTSFEHPQSFPLLGKHAAASCVGCHGTRSFAAAPTQCVDCHRADDAHAGRNGPLCGACHNSAAWPGASFDHASVGGFALRGAHRNLACDACHLKTSTAALPTTCVGCHGSDDPHAGRFGAECAACHSNASWRQTSFDHAASTGFTLAGAHEKLACESCHAAGTPVRSECASCHGDDPHRGQLGGRCETCHGPQSWHAPLRFDHGLASFPLLGKHVALECGQCHASLAFHDAGGTCVECHAEDDPHGGAFGTSCAACHNPSSWQAVTFDHGAQTGFELTGPHSALECASCHGGGRAGAFAAAPACGQCHRRDDPHGGRFGADCASCHGTDSFRDIRPR